MKKPILVTGSHRSGSTWIGKMISESPEVGYVHEPFNLGIKRFNQPFDHWFEFISEYCSQDHQDKVETYMHSFYGFPSTTAFARLSKVRSFYDLYFYFADIGNLKRRMGQRTLFKDPIAIMSSEWLHKKLDCDVIITVRHPAAFVASLKVKGWEFDFNNFFDQSNLMRVYLSDYRAEIETAVKEQPDVVSQGILLWNAIYTTVWQFKEKYKDAWLIVKHEDLSINPMDEYARIFDYLKLEFTDRVKQAIVKSTTATEGSKHKRDSAKNVQTWKQRLSPEEIALIKEKTAPIWTKYYTEADW